MNLKAIAVAIGICSTSLLSGQEWFPDDGLWYYNQTEFFPGGNYYKIFEVDGEAIIQGKSCKLVKGNCDCSTFGANNYLYEEGDKVFRYNPVKDSFDILYDFTMQVGDTLTIPLGDSDPGIYVLNSISTQFIHGIPIRVQHFELLEWYVSIGFETYEYIGNSECMYPQYGFCDPLTGALRCYQDSFFGLQKFNGFHFPCDTVITSLHNPDAQNVEIFPNPADDLVNIKSTDPICMVEILDPFSGRSLIRLRGDTEFEVPVSHLPSATYLVKMTLENHQFAFKKLVILH